MRRSTLPNGLQVGYQSKAELQQFYDDIFEKRVYTRNGITLRAGDWVFDVGANIGLFTVFIAHHYPGARVFAFEPAPPVFEILQANAAGYPEARLFNCGLSSRRGEALLTFYPHSSGMSSFHADEQEEKAALRVLIHNELAQGKQGLTELMHYEDELIEERFRSDLLTCPLRTLSEVIREHSVPRIDLLKVDVEKSEMEVLDGLEDADWDKVEQAVIEVHDLADRLQRMKARFRDRGFVIELEQDELYRGSDRWNLYARRESRAGEAAPGRDGPRGEPAPSRADDRMRNLRESMMRRRRQGAP
jgi:FkbM family methyltransferase